MPDTDHGSGPESRLGDREMSALRAAELRLMQQVGFDIDAGLAAIKQRARQDAQESARRSGRELRADGNRSRGPRRRHPVVPAGRRPPGVTCRQSRAVALATSVIVVVGLVILARAWPLANPSPAAGGWVTVANLIDDGSSPALDGLGPVSLDGISYGLGTYVRCDSAPSAAITVTTADDHVTWTLSGYTRFRGVAGVAEDPAGPDASAYLYFWDQNNRFAVPAEPTEVGSSTSIDLDIRHVTSLRMSCLTVGRDAADPTRIAVAATAQRSVKG